MRKAISPELRLALTLHYLATGQNFFTLHAHFRDGKSKAATIVQEVCIAIWEALLPMCLRLPATEDDWNAAAQG